MVRSTPPRKAGARPAQSRPQKALAPHASQGPASRPSADDKLQKLQKPLGEVKIRFNGERYLDSGLKQDSVFFVSTVADWKHLKPKITEKINELTDIYAAKGVHLDRVSVVINENNVRIEFFGQKGTVRGHLRYLISNDNLKYAGGIDRGPPAIGMAEKLKSKFDPNRPRWAEENRSNKQIKLRLDPDLIAKVERRASEEGLTRTDWIVRALKRDLEP